MVNLLAIPTALGPTDPDDGPEGRQLRGMAIAAQTAIQKNKLGYKVPSQSGNGSYIVSIADDPFCSCPDFEKPSVARCKHLYAVEFVSNREQQDGARVETVSRVTYSQDWPAYNKAQVYEQEYFGSFLRELCDTISQPPQGKGRPRLPLSDMVFAAGVKVYSTMSGRRAMTDVREAKAKGQMDRLPSFTSIFRYLENPALTPVLQELIRRSALPLKGVETNFAVDSSGFATTTYDRWFDQKWGKERKEAKFVKVHLICGVKTQVVTGVEVTDTPAHDSLFFKPLVQRTARDFDVAEVSADKAYLSRPNLHMADDIGATPYIPFKSNSLPRPRNGKGYDSLWERTYHYYHFNRDEFCAHYHQRSNVETAFAMIKAKFGAYVRSKTPAAQINECLVKVLCHNIVVLIQSVFELGIAPVFWAEGLLEQNANLFQKSA